VAKLESEYNIEKDMRDEDSYNQTIREYIDNSPFDVRFAPFVNWCRGFVAYRFQSASFKLGIQGTVAASDWGIGQRP
jgi:hypothetical protein